MNASTAFTGGAGFSMTAVATLIAGVATAVVLLWAGWAWLSTWRGWAAKRVRGEVFQMALVRILLIAVVVFWLFLSNGP
ncbi:TIGR03758 family integrating conjugative element protein [Salinisphaera orenii]|uniref:TIGR03758 family integrating conjugative element protein n=1 Tax=Salinisphaera orenii TaxID=856731 RepID=UPI000DBE8180